MSDDRALLTGFPGFIGTRLARRLLGDDPSLHLVALVEPRMAERARTVAAGIDPARLTVLRVLEVMEGDLSIAPCLNQTVCKRAASCVTQAIWRKADQAIRRVFQKTTIGKLAETTRATAADGSLHYDI